MAVRSGDDRQVCHRLLQRLALARRAIIGIYFPPIPWPMTLTDILKAMSAPVRPYGAVFAFFGGAQQSIRGNYQYFEMDQNRLGGVMNQLNEAELGEHIYCVLCGRMTPNQKQIV